jgi:hypothetical protein
VICKTAKGGVRNSELDVHGYRATRSEFLDAIGHTYEMVDADLRSALVPTGYRLTYWMACEAVLDYIVDHGGLNPAAVLAWGGLTSTERRAMVRVALREYFTPGEAGLEGL